MENELETKETDQENDAVRPEAPESPSLRAPLVITIVSLLIWFCFQTVALIFERNNLIAVNRNFEAGLKEAQKMQAQLETLITKTAELASKGNANARVAFEELQKRGVPLPSATSPAK
jgi:hypothetical protein